MLVARIREITRSTLDQRAPTDDEVQTLAYHHLDGHGHFRGRLRSITIEACQGTLILQGRVPSFYLKQVLQTALRNVPGVLRICNRVEVVSSQGLSTTSPSSGGYLP